MHAALLPITDSRMGLSWQHWIGSPEHPRNGAAASIATLLCSLVCFPPVLPLPSLPHHSNVLGFCSLGRKPPNRRLPAAVGCIQQKVTGRPSPSPLGYRSRAAAGVRPTP